MHHSDEAKKKLAALIEETMCDHDADVSALVQIQHHVCEMHNFIEQAYEIAFGDDALGKGHSTDGEVLTMLRMFSDLALTEGGTPMD